MSAKKSKDADIKQKIVACALELAVEQGWEYTSLRDISARAEIKPAELYDVIDDKNDVLVLLGRMIDRRVLDGISIDDEASPRDRLFDIMMDRYEVLNDYRGGLVSILESFKCDPKQMVISFPHLCRSMSWMLETAGIETSGIKGALKVAGLSGVYLKVLRVWKDDESADLAKTMAALDKALERAESVADTLGF
ncbi:MAG: TetR family transcriptional regulator [Alphaproteobacteria bacterium]